MSNLENSTQFLWRDRDDDVRRSTVSGKKVGHTTYSRKYFSPKHDKNCNLNMMRPPFALQILLKVEKSKEDKLEESKRNETLKFSDASFD